MNIHIILGSKSDMSVAEKAQEILEKFNVKCPQCGSIFEAEKQPDGITRTKCPNCGKEGVIK